MGSKQRRAVLPAGGATPQRQVRVGVLPEGEWQTASPSWLLGNVDLAGPFSWASLSPATAVRLLGLLRSFESMSWREILQKDSCGEIETSRLAKRARERLEELRLEDIASLMHLRVTGRERLWGIRDGQRLRILWWDPEHAVYPVTLKNT